MKTFTQFKKETLADPEVRKIYDDLEQEFALAALIIQKRLDKGLSQAQLAKKMGTKQSAISRLESGSSNPSIGMLGKVAKALGTNLKISFS